MSDTSYHGPVVAFDLDDTLVRERDYCRSGFRYLCDPDRYRVAGMDPYPSKEELDILAEKMDRELTAGRNPFMPFEELFGKAEGWDLALHITAYRRHRPEGIHLADGAKTVLDALSETGIRMALITDGRSVTQRRKIEALGLEKYIAPEMILISEETGHEKTDSKEMFADVVREYPEASGFWYVGNNPLKDFYYPNLLGWTTMQVAHHPDDVHPYYEPPTPLHAAKLQIGSLTDLLNEIPNLKSNPT